MLLKDRRLMTSPCGRVTKFKVHLSDNYEWGRMMPELGDPKIGTRVD